MNSKNRKAIFYNFLINRGNRNNREIHVTTIFHTIPSVKFSSAMVIWLMIPMNRESRLVILENASTPEVFIKVHRNLQAIFTLLEHTPAITSENL